MSEQILRSLLSQPLKGLTMKNPYAWLMLLGKIETRTRRTNYRGPVLITSSQLPFNDVDIRRISGGRQALAIEVMHNNGNDLLHGHAIAIGFLEACYEPYQLTHPANELLDLTFCSESYLRTSHSYGWQFRDVLPIQPFAVKGQRGLWDANSLKSQIQLLR